MKTTSNHHHYCLQGLCWVLKDNLVQILGTSRCKVAIEYKKTYVEGNGRRNSTVLSMHSQPLSYPGLFTNVFNITQDVRTHCTAEIKTTP